MKVEFSSGAFKLAALLDLPPGDVKAFAIIAPCFTCSKNSKTSAYLARAMARHDIACLRLDFKGLGDSEGDFVKNTLTSNVEDILAAADFLAAEYEPPKLFIGHSFGGPAAIRAAGRSIDCRAVAVINSPGDPKHITSYFPERLPEIRQNGSAMIDIAGRPFPIGHDLLRDLEADDAANALVRLNKPLLILHAPADDVVPIAKAEQTFQMAHHPKSFITLPDADHFLSKPADPDYAAAIIATWSSRFLG